MFRSSEREVRLMRRLGHELRRQRLASAARQCDLARRMGISVPTYRRMEKGQGSVPIAYWVRVATIMGHISGLETLLAIQPPDPSSNAAAPGRTSANYCYHYK